MRLVGDHGHRLVRDPVHRATIRGGLYDFGAGALRWLIRVEAYMLLLIDDYPPFSLTVIIDCADNLWRRCPV